MVALQQTGFTRVFLFYQGGRGEAEAALPDVQLSRFAGADLLCQL